MENQDPNMGKGVPSWKPQLWMKFNTVAEAWDFWEYYGGRMGFSVRKRYTNTSKIDGVVTSCKFVCFKEGKKAVDKRDNLTKKGRAEIRTDCAVHMAITVDREDGSYEIFGLDLEHNHMLQLPEARHLLPSQRRISEIQAFEIEIADDSGIAPKNAHEFASRRVGGPGSLSYTRRDHKNHLRTKRQRELKYGEAGSVLKYFQDKAIENPAIFEAFQAEYGRSMAACVDKLSEDNEYMVKIGRLVDGKFSIFEEEHKVIGDKNLQTTSCSCGQFERIGILCGHALKVLDLMNIKLLPAHYIVKRWTREARSGSIKDCRGRTVVENPKLDAIIRCNYVSHKFYNLTTLAASSEECCILIENALDSVNKVVKERLGICATNPEQRCDVQMTPQVSDELLSVARLKKKEVQKKSSKRKKNFLDRQHKLKRKTPSAHKEERDNMPTQTDSLENVASKNSANKSRPAPNESGSENYGFMGSFAHLLTTPIAAEDFDDDIF